MVGRRAGQEGLTYFWFLLVILVLSLGIGQYLDFQSSVVRRLKEAELLRVGTLYQEAIGQYYLSSPNGLFQYPERLEDLLRDPRHVVVRRYIRHLYPDPITGQPFKLIVFQRGGISGVRSSSASQPIGTHPPEGVSIGLSVGYESWKFVYSSP
jgi:hypothetical protein